MAPQARGPWASKDVPTPRGEPARRPQPAAAAPPWRPPAAATAAAAAATGRGRWDRPAAAPRLRAGGRPGLERRGFPRLHHPHAAPGRAGGRRGAPGQLLHAAAVHAIAEPAAHRPLPGTQRPRRPSSPAPGSAPAAGRSPPPPAAPLRARRDQACEPLGQWAGRPGSFPLTGSEQSSSEPWQRGLRSSRACSPQQPLRMPGSRATCILWRPSSLSGFSVFRFLKVGVKGLLGTVRTWAL